MLGLKEKEGRKYWRGDILTPLGHSLALRFEVVDEENDAWIDEGAKPGHKVEHADLLHARGLRAPDKEDVVVLRGQGEGKEDEKANKNVPSLRI